MVDVMHVCMFVMEVYCSEMQTALHENHAVFDAHSPHASQATVRKIS